MNKELTDKLYKAKVGLMDLIDNGSVYNIKVDNILVQKRIIFALECIDDVIEGKIRF